MRHSVERATHQEQGDFSENMIGGREIVSTRKSKLKWKKPAAVLLTCALTVGGLPAGFAPLTANAAAAGEAIKTSVGTTSVNYDRNGSAQSVIIDKNLSIDYDKRFGCGNGNH
ncbi:hypothetical protein VQ056_09405 [Paenibacillus sp. JTLBN-2024]